MEYSITFPAGDVPGSMPTGSLPSFLPQGGSSSLESSALIFNLKCSTKSQTTQTRQSQIDARFTSRNHRSIIHNCNERSPLLRVPHSCNIRSLSGYGSHTGEVVLCWSLFEESRHEHMSDEHKTLWYIKSVMYLDSHHGREYETPQVVKMELNKRGGNKRTNRSPKHAAADL